MKLGREVRIYRGESNERMRKEGRYRVGWGRGGIAKT